VNPLTLLRRSRRLSPGRRPHRLPPRLELLEHRLVPSGASGTTLVKDFVPGSDGSSIYQMADLNGTLLLSVQDGGSGFQGVELWKSNGTAAGTAVVAGVEALSPFTVIGGTAFFAGEDATTPDFELFKTDGTTAGTVWIDPGGNMSHPGDLTDVSGTLFFSAYDPAHGFELWKSDGTAAGTALVKDINPGSGGSSPVRLTNVNGTLFFTASDGTAGGSGLWKSDGTAAGTVRVKGVGATNLTNVNGTLFFTGYDKNNGGELWTSDGTAKGTKMVKDIYPGSTTFTIPPPYYGHGGPTRIKIPNSSNPTNLVNVNGTLYFVANDVGGLELWKSDGTSKGTVLVSGINLGSGNRYTVDLTNVNGTLFFSGSGGSGRELWTSDGTAAGTMMVKDINPGSAGSYPSNLTDANGTLYFVADDGTHGPELWKSDGTAAGTTLVKDINPGNSGSYPAVLTLSGGHLFFTADDGVHGTELWDPQVEPSSGTATPQTPQGILDPGDGRLLNAPPGQGVVAAVLPTAGIGWAPQIPDATHGLAEDAVWSVRGRGGDAKTTDSLGQVFVGTDGHAQRSRVDLALTWPWDVDPTGDLAPGSQMA
jgi:ELWxxDGT repeat protein